MKVALLFTGQYREIPELLFKNSLSNLTNGLDYDIFSFVWDEKGKSLDHSKKLKELSNDDSAKLTVENLLRKYNLKEIKSERFDSFLNNLNQKQKKIYKSNFYHFGTINSLPQIYSISKCFNLIGNDIYKYDLIFRCRFDSLYIHPLKIYDLEKMRGEKILYNINFGRAYFPERVYDIFFGGSIESVIFLRDIWEKVPLLVNDKFNNKLDKRDACRILFLAAIKKDIKVSSLSTRICDVFRNKKNNYYEKYLISMHLLSFGLNKTSIPALIYFFKWIKYRKLKLIILILYIFKSFFIIPFSYSKRLFLKFK